MKPVIIYSTRICGYCMRAKAVLQSKHLKYTEYLVDLDPSRRQEMEQKSGRRSVPQIFIGDNHVGGYEELHALEITGTLDKMLQG
ncbi:MAG: glutaredoxin 3 [Gammaproteobacteria bacterium]|nr:glutaredoxin 3 [Gammaproteobacteria bacterium]